MPQRHDIGYRKRVARQAPPDRATPPDYLARQLVRRGLASRSILNPDPPKQDKPKKHRYTNPMEYRT